jgi:restriction system protein
LYREWKAARPDEDAGDSTDSGRATATLEEAVENAWSEVRSYLLEMNPYDFQNLVAALLKGMGYHIAWVAPPGPDRGVDIVAYNDPLGTELPRIKGQVKRKQDKTGVDGIRSFLAVLGSQDVGLFVSTGGFTKEAEAEARMQEVRQVTLVDLERLFDLWVEHYDQIDEQDRQLLPLQPVHYLAAGD